MVSPNAVTKVACIGTGTIGAGWAAFFLAHGLKVSCWDPAPGYQDKLKALVDDAWGPLTKMGLAPTADRRNLQCCATLAEAVSDAEFVQESAPDREQLKIDLLSEISKSAPSSTIIASSSSLFRPSVLQTKCAHPERVIIGHPFVPSYLLPLVEIIVAPDTPKEIVSWSEQFYSGRGKQVVTLKREYDAYIANRLQTALIAEALRLIDEGVCDYADIDDVIAYGIGIRWGFMGPGIAAHLAGGKGGIKALHEHFGWMGSENARQNLLTHIERVAGSTSIQELEAWRDDNIIALLKARKTRPSPRS
ncbi:3-hydroxyacyl-CoA dehydrogenase NAD-binding domain-containing protein [Leptospira interrogans]